MAWELDESFLAAIRDDVEAELDKWSDDDLIQAIVDEELERAQNDVNDDEDFDMEEADAELKGKLATFRGQKDVLIDLVFEAIERTRTTDNGGWAIWIDPDGYHRVSVKG